MKYCLLLNIIYLFIFACYNNGLSAAAGPVAQRLFAGCQPCFLRLGRAKVFAFNGGNGAGRLFCRPRHWQAAKA